MRLHTLLVLGCALAAGMVGHLALGPTRTLVAAPAEGQGPIEGENVRIEGIDLGTHWFGAEIDRQDFVGKVVLVELWGS